MSEIISAVPKEIKDDILWKIKVYRQAIQLYDKSWDDSESIRKKHYFFLADQIIRSVGSISANIAEGYSRSSIKDKSRFYEYALGSARESRDWYYKARHVLDRNEVRSRMQDLEIIIKLLHVMIRNNRKRS